jgi:alpha-D-ribose 1-methylphosphonate 5-triphosphate synthase subunit PhnH
MADPLLTVRPGDKLIVSVKALTAEKAAEFQQNAKVFMPGVDLILIEAEQVLVYRPDETASEEADGG